MNVFVASNGKRIEALEDGQVAIVQPIFGSPMEHRTWAGPGDVQALREFFLAERDAELGRWRSKEHPEWFAVAEGIGVRVCNEAMARVYGFASPVLTAQYAYNAEGRIAGQVARDFFAAHPEPKPWYDAKPGEVWVIEAADWGTKACIVDVDYFTWAEHALPVTSEQITAGRRIWPEEQGVVL